MKRLESKKPKKDFIFITVVTAIVVAFVLGSLLFTNQNSGSSIQPSDLPDTEENKNNKLIINEIMSSNSGNFYYGSGDVDYIEIYNGKDTDIDLTGYGLSDKDDRVKWLFPDGTIIPAKSYLVVACTGNDVNGLEANFKLSGSGGEKIILVNSGKKVIDGVDTVSLGKNQALCRDGNGGWFVSNYGTPGYENTKEGLTQYLNSLMAEEDNDLVINEFLCKNDGNYINENQRLDGFIEIKNTGDKTIQLKDYSLSNDANLPFKYQLPDISLSAGEIYLLYTGNASYLEENYCGFSLVNKTGAILLSYQGKVVQEIDYNNLTNGYSYQRMSDASYKASGIISPGYENNLDGVVSFQKENIKSKSELLINEVMTQNDDYLSQNGNNYYDWIELYNNSGATILLSEYCLSTSDNNLNSYQLPEIYLGAGEYYIIMASGDVNLTNKSYYHCNFKLSDTESVFLSKNNEIVDCMFVSEVPYGYSYGRYGAEGFYYMSPTPGKGNAEGKRMISFTPEITEAGIYDVSTVDVEIDAYGTVYYTTDGSNPTTSSRVYNGPICLNTSTVIKTMSVEEGKMKSEIVTSSYIVNQDHSLPVMSISMDSSDFYRLEAYAFAEDYELAAHAEFFEASGSFNVGCSISLFGGNARNFDKKCYALRFDSEYGDSELVYPLFDHRDNTVYDAIVLRQGSNDWSRTIFRDVMSTSLMDDYLDTQDYKACVLYINGQYRGIYNIREKVNASFIADHYNVSKESVSITEVDYSVKTGSENFYNEVVVYAKTHDMSKKENYDYICSVLDIENVIDYWIAESFFNNQDVHNVRYFKSSELDGGKWKYILYDLDFAFRAYGINYYTSYLCNPYGMTGFVENTYDNTIPRVLFDNDEFVELWLQRLAYHLNNALSQDNLNAKLQEMIDLYADEIQRDRGKWQYSFDPIVEEYPTMANYNSNISMIKTFIAKRQSYILSQTKSYFGLSNARMKEIFGDLW